MVLGLFGPSRGPAQLCPDFGFFRLEIHLGHPYQLLNEITGAANLLRCTVYSPNVLGRGKKSKNFTPTWGHVMMFGDAASMGGAHNVRVWLGLLGMESLRGIEGRCFLFSPESVQAVAQ